MSTANAPAPKNALAWYQYTLRRLLIYVSLFAILCSWFGVKLDQARKQKKAVSNIKLAHGTVIPFYSPYPMHFRLLCA
jgi:MFS-type transporter involved in bile tolerance (Atg22 family)